MQSQFRYLLNKISHHFECPLCLQFYNNEMKLPMMICHSQHAACKSCIQAYLFKNVEEDKCPICKVKITKTFIGKFRILDQLKGLICDEELGETKIKEICLSKQCKEKMKNYSEIIQVYTQRIQHLQEQNKSLRFLLQKQQSKSQSVQKQKSIAINKNNENVDKQMKNQLFAVLNLEEQKLLERAVKKQNMFIKYIKISYQDVSNIDRKKLPSSQFSLKEYWPEKLETVRDTIEIMKKLQDLPKNFKARLWKIRQSELNKEQLIEYIRQESKPQTTYRFYGRGELIQDQDLNISEIYTEESYFLLEACDEYQGFYFLPVHQSKCENCYKYKKLTHICQCKKVGYCSEYCQEKDRQFHQKNCKFTKQLPN